MMWLGQMGAMAVGYWSAQFLVFWLEPFTPYSKLRRRRQPTKEQE